MYLKVFRGALGMGLLCHLPGMMEIFDSSTAERLTSSRFNSKFKIQSR